MKSEQANHIPPQPEPPALPGHGSNLTEVKQFEVTLPKPRFGIM